MNDFIESKTALKIALVLFALVLSKSTLVLAGGQTVGNGGDIIIAHEKNNRQSYHLADYFFNRSESLHIWKNGRYQFDMGPSSLSLHEKINFVLQRVSTFSPQLAQRYHDFIFHILLPSEPFVQGPLPNIQDEYFSWDTQALKNQTYEARQGAIQYPENTHAKRFLIDRDLFGKLSVEHQVGLLLHEAIYYDIIQYTAQFGKDVSSSTNVRKLVVLFSGTQFAQQHDFLKIWHLREHFRWMDFKGCSIRLFRRLNRPNWISFSWEKNSILDDERERWNPRLSGLIFSQSGKLIGAKSYSGREMTFSETGQVLSGPCEQNP